MSREVERIEADETPPWTLWDRLEGTTWIPRRVKELAVGDRIRLPDGTVCIVVTGPGVDPTTRRWACLVQDDPDYEAPTL